MSEYTLSPNMSLPIPNVGVAPGPNYAADIDNCLTIVDGHTHAFGSGTQITPNGLNINTDLSIQSNNVVSVRTVRFTPQSAVITGATPDLGCLYEVVNDLYYNDGLGNQVRITQSGGVAGSPGSISGLVSPASASYSPGTQTFTWQSGANIPANMDMGSIIIRDITAGSQGITISPPAALASSYSVTLPASLPVSTSFMALDSSGNISSPVAVSHGITNSNIALSTVLPSNMGPANVQVSSSSGVWTVTPGALLGYIPIQNLSTTMTTFGRPVDILMQPDGGTAFCNMTYDGTPMTFAIAIFRNSTQISAQLYSPTDATNGIITINNFALKDVVAAGTYTYTAQIVVESATLNSLTFKHFVLVTEET